MHRRQNQYKGVNAHLHSHHQQRGGWGAFQHAYVTEIAAEIAEMLRPYPQYQVEVAPSLQTAQHDLYPSETTSTSARAEADPQPRQRDLSDLTTMAAKPTYLLPLTNLYLEEQQIPAIVIYKNTPFTRIEVLSPASKPGGSHYYQYLVRRSQSLLDGMKLVEVDYLHQRRSVISDLPDYTRQEPGAYPYLISVSEMTSRLGPGQVRGYAFRVEDPIPAVPIPLDDVDVLTYDFGAAYHRTFAADTLNGLRHVDYAELPEGFETYTQSDQQRIKVRMNIVADQLRDN